MVATNRFGVLLGICVLMGSGAAAAQKPKLTLAEAIARANRVQPGVISANGNILNAQARIRSASGAFLPNLNLTANRGDNFTQGPTFVEGVGLVTTGSYNRTIGTTLNSSVDLFAGFRRKGEKKAASANRDAAVAGYQDAQYQQQLATTNTFFDVLAAQQLMVVSAASVRRAEEQLKVAVAKLQAGRGIRPDSLRSLVTLGSAQLALVNAQTALATAEANLGRLVGEDGPVGAVDDSSLYQMMPALDTAATRAEAIANAPSVKSAEAQAASARASITVAKAAYYPTLSLGGQVALNGSSRNSYTFFQSRGATFGLNWPIFNRFQREQSIVASQVTADVADASAAEARRQVLAGLTSALASLDAARIRIGISETSVQAGQEDLRVQQERYRLGVATIVDVLTSQEALSQAEVDVVTARFDYVRARAQISALIGRTL